MNNISKVLINNRFVILYHIAYLTVYGWSHPKTNKISTDGSNIIKKYKIVTILLNKI